VHAAFAVTAALSHAARTGHGQLVELPMIETVMNATAIQPMEAEVFGVTLSRQGNRGHGGAIQNLYRCAGEDDWIAVTVCTDEQWQALVDVMGRPSWTDDDRLGAVAGRRERADDIDRELQAWFGARELSRVVDDLAAVGIPAAPVISPSLVTENPQLQERGFFETLDHPRTGPGRYPRPPFAPLGGQQSWLMRPPPTLGEHNGEVLRGLCGLSDEDLARLTAAGVIGTRPKGL
jgi:crotonobetainyl-CoA:carnitine CoA-transferase CaiB-like acyl-CoA transferase